jgi:hypothetical protein
MPAGSLHLSLSDQARIVSLFLDEIRRKAGVRALARAAWALGSPRSLRRQAGARRMAAGPLLPWATGVSIVFRSLRRSLGPHRALGTLRSAVMAATRGIRLPPPLAAADPLDALAEALEATLAAGQELGLYEVRWLDGPPGTVQLEVLRCRIHEACHAAGAPEVTSCFCDAEAPVLTRSDPQIVLIRDATIARGAPLCRFTFHMVERLDRRRTAR